jgi:hypothetical protein
MAVDRAAGRASRTVLRRMALNNSQRRRKRNAGLMNSADAINRPCWALSDYGSINRINGMIGMTFSCGGAHYIRLETFATAGSDDRLPALACV